MGGEGEGGDRRRGVEVLEARRDEMSMSISKVEVQAMQVRVRDVAEADGLSLSVSDRSGDGLRREAT